MRNISLLLALLCPAFLFAQNYPKGKVLEGLTLQSELLGEDVRYTLYLPADYETSNRRYPVVYLLHGYTDDDTGWLQFGEANRIADEAIAEGEIPPMILVMPDAKVTWYINNYSGKVRYEDMLIEELIPHVDKNYRTRSKREFRGVAGLSMGGFGSLILSMHHPDLFTACAAFSSASYTEEMMKNMPKDRYEQVFGVLYGPGLKGSDRVTNHFKANNPLTIVQNGDVEELKKVRYYLDCGDDDFLTVANAQLHIAMKEKNIPHEYRVRNGAHNWTYWRTGLKDGLKFIGKDFHR